MVTGSNGLASQHTGTACRATTQTNSLYPQGPGSSEWGGEEKTQQKGHRGKKNKPVSLTDFDRNNDRNEVST